MLYFSRFKMILIWVAVAITVILAAPNLFSASTLALHGRYREVRPEIVLEIAFDHIQPSTRHESGLALRFPRIKRIRTDKTPADIDTLTHARKLAASNRDGP